MQWTNLSNKAQLEQIIKAMPGDILIFKHSFRCSISQAIKKRLESSDLHLRFKVYLIDVVDSRPTSLYLANQLDVQHESPQVLLLKNGKCYFHASHFDITEQAILAVG